MFKDSALRATFVAVTYLIYLSAYYLKWFLLIVASLYLPFHSLPRYLKDQNWDLNEAHADGVMIGHSEVALS